MKNQEASQELVVRKSVLIKAGPLDVWNALTNPKLTKKYFFNCEVHSDWQLGSPIVWTGNYNDKPVEVKGRILQIEPGKLLKYTAWSKESGLEDIPKNHTIVTAVLEPLENETRLTVTDENFGWDRDAEKRYQASVQGWDMVLKGLKEIVER
jgi:uncharacterized protein YndB with AHSA1/START domain